MTVKSTLPPRGIRNNNPGNLNFAHQKGAVLEPGPNARFARFPTPEAGLAALRDQLYLYMTRDKLRTVNAIIYKWAPTKENNTTAYAQFVAKKIGVKVSDDLGPPTPTLIGKIMAAITEYENGQNPYGSLIAKVAANLPSKGASV
ncbi:structural protein P5 [Bombella sp. TMW 2.2559]|uniref:Structural protein P5 n=1 Tax=Bombella dulcis TaxID=2967339 RepID=A0ABT3WBY6_9PROT|nr:structural protein P5 [Bombella dulcis]MCX5616358.1 structural protein P5 [Bombella dulcis]